MKKRTAMQLSIAALMATTSAFSMAAVSSDQAITELHWSGKVPLEMSGDSVILTGLNGVLLNTALKDGDLYVQKDGTFESAGVTLELHQRMCEDAGATGATVVCSDSTAGAAISETDERVVGAPVTSADWSLMSVRYTVGGAETSDFTDAKVLMGGEDINTSSDTNWRQTFSVKNSATISSELVATTSVSAFATIMVKGTI